MFSVNNKYKQIKKRRKTTNKQIREKKNKNKANVHVKYIKNKYNDHKLGNPWTIYIHDKLSKDWSKKSYLKLYTFSTVEGFWIFFKTKIKNIIGQNHDYFLMRGNIFPRYDEKEHQGAGSYRMTIRDPIDSQKVFVSAAIQTLTESWVDRSQYSQIYGISISSKAGICAILKVWMSAPVTKPIKIYPNRHIKNKITALKWEFWENHVNKPKKDHLSDRTYVAVHKDINDSNIVYKNKEKQYNGYNGRYSDQNRDWRRRKNNNFKQYNNNNYKHNSYGFKENKYYGNTNNSTTLKTTNNIKKGKNGFKVNKNNADNMNNSDTNYRSRNNNNSDTNYRPRNRYNNTFQKNETFCRPPPKNTKK